ncbi:MAG TPA: ABC transporter permease [Syntrophales bacterium]|nr:ABC transporter permease [Syntrophales bacterium]
MNSRENVSIIEPRASWTLLDLQELWHYRDLFYFLAWRDVKVRYRQTVLGGLWAVLQPLMTMGIFTIFFGQLAGVPSDGLPYPLFVYTALLPWQFFSNAVSNSGNSLIASTQLISKVYFPRIIIPSSSILCGLLDFAVAFILLVPMMVYYGIVPGSGILLLPVLMAGFIMAAIGVGSILSALNVHYRDFRYVVPFMVQIWLFVTPVIYPASMVPERWRWMINLNPMAGLISAFRASLLDQAVPWADLVVSGLVVLLIFAIGLFVFLRMERRFADVI